MIRALLLCLVCLLAEGADGVGVLKGRVENSLNSSGIAGVTVILTESSGFQRPSPKTVSVLSATDGSFSFLNVPAGPYSLNTLSAGVSAGFSVITFDPSHDVVPIIIKIEPKAILQGVVRDENGYPFPNADLMLLSRWIQDGRARINQVASARTNDLGEYRFANLQPGHFLLCWNVPATRYQLHKRFAYPVGCFPGAVAPSQAQWLELGPGKSSTIDFTVSPVAAGWISGTVEGAEGCQVSFDMKSRSQNAIPLWLGFPLKWEQEKGAFQIRGVPAGKYRSIFRSSDGSIFTIFDFDSSGQDISGLRLAPTQLAPLTGILRYIGDLPPDSSVHIQLTGDGWYDATSTPDHTFATKGVEPGKYEIEVRLPSPWYVKSILQDGKDLLETGLQVESNITLNPVEIEIAKGVGTLNITATGGENGEIVVLKCSAGGIRQVRQARFSGLSPSAGLTLPDVPPGEYQVFGWKIPNDIEYRNPEVLKQYEALGQTVTIQEGTTAKITVPLQSP